LKEAVPSEIDVRKKTEIFVRPGDGYKFDQPVPTGLKGTPDYHTSGRVSCSFGQFGSSMGMYINSTTMLCLSPHIPGTSDDYSSVKVKLAVAFNGQDFLEDTSSASVTFVGTGTNHGYILYLFTALLIALFLIALVTCLFALFNF
jgi:hypothetical protein